MTRYCDNDLITFNLQGLLWIAKKERVYIKPEEHYYLELQYRTQHIELEYPNQEIRDSAYEKGRALLTSRGTERC